MHTRLVLVATAALLVGGTVAILLLEWNNPRTLAGLPMGERFLAAWFQSVTARTAGFNTIDIGAMTHPALFVMMALMFIGASPGSTGGGVKTTTFAITLAALWATVRGADDTVIFKRRLAPEVVAKAFFISLIAFVALNAVAWLALLTEGRSLLETLFETTSAFGTVGLSMGQPGAPVSLSAFFSPAGKLLMMAMMFIGRVGPLTLAIAVARAPRRPAQVAVPRRQDSDRISETSMAKRTFAVIGLGRFGSAMATTLSQLGHEVIGIDGDDDRVTALADQVSHTVKLDATDERALRAAGIKDVDVAVVSIGENIESSLLVVTLVKELGIANIVAKAVTPLHGRILEKLGVTRVVFPEREMAVRVAHSLVIPNVHRLHRAVGRLLDRGGAGAARVLRQDRCARSACGPGSA